MNESPSLETTTRALVDFAKGAASHAAASKAAATAALDAPTFAYFHRDLIKHRLMPTMPPSIGLNCMLACRVGISRGTHPCLMM
jgi:hypothetical protein